MVVGHPDAKFKNTTTYRDAHNPKANPNNDYAYKLIKEKNLMTHALNADRPGRKVTEYQRNY